MAKILVAREIIADALFAYSVNPVRVNGVESGGDSGVVFDIEGDDIPAAPEVRAICSVQTNRAGQKFVTMTFEPV